MTETDYKLDNNEPPERSPYDLLRPMIGDNAIAEMFEEMAQHEDLSAEFAFAKRALQLREKQKDLTFIEMKIVGYSFYVLKVHIFPGLSRLDLFLLSEMDLFDSILLISPAHNGVFVSMMVWKNE